MSMDASAAETAAVVTGTLTSAFSEDCSSSCCRTHPPSSMHEMIKANNRCVIVLLELSVEVFLPRVIESPRVFEPLQFPNHSPIVARSVLRRRARFPPHIGPL